MVPNLYMNEYQSDTVFRGKSELLLKEKVLEILQSLPDQFPLDVLVERLILLEKINTGLQQVEEGKIISQEEAKASLKKWQK